MAPEQDCLQYHTAASGKTLIFLEFLNHLISSLGTIASFNWDTSSATVSATQYHLTSQYYDICIRRARTSCSICYSPQIASAAPGTASSYGLGAGSVGSIQTNAIGSSCTGVTALDAAIAANNLGFGDYLDIVALQASIGTTGSLGSNRICGALFNAGPATTVPATACSWAVPFKVGVHFDADDAIGAPPDLLATAMHLNKFENDPAATTGAGYGYSGFYLAYWQNSC